MEQKPEMTDEKKVEDVSSSVKGFLTNRTVNYAVIVFASVLVALFAGVLIGIAIFKKTAKEIPPAQLERRAAVTAPAYRPISSSKNVVQENPAPEKVEKKAQEIKRHARKVVRIRRQSAPGQVARLSGENLETTLQAAKEGNAEAQYRLGSMYAKGAGVKKDMEEAYRWYHRAAGQGHTKAQEALEYVYE